VQPFADKLVEHVRCGDVTQAIALVPNTTDARWFQTLLAAAAGVCFPACRIKFWHPNKPSAIPFQGHAFLYFGPCRPAFAATFRSLGCICYAPQ